MKYLNPYQFTSLYQEPRLLHKDDDEEEKEGNAEDSSMDDDRSDSEDDGDSGDDSSNEEGNAEEGEEDVDPLEEKNPFEEGSKEHKAFEKQREKFKKRLDAAKAEGVSAERIDAMETKLDDVLKKLSGGKQEKKQGDEGDDEATKPTDVDVKLVKNALKETGFDVDAHLKTERLRQIQSSVDSIQKEYPHVKIDAAELVKFANDTGISATGAPIKDILELAFLRKYKDKIAKTEKDTEKKKKKPPVDISSGSTGSAPNKKDQSSSVADWRQKMRKKHGEG